MHRFNQALILLFISGFTKTFFLFFAVKFLLLLCKYLMRSSACDVSNDNGVENTDETQGILYKMFIFDIIVRVSLKQCD